MAIFDTAWYLNYGNGSSTGYFATAQWTALTAYTAGQRVRQLAAPTVGNERIFICIIAGTSLASEPTWVLTYGAKTAEAAGPTWMEITGRSAVNGDLTNTNNWTALKNKALVLGQLMVNVAADHYFIVTTAGTTGNGAEPSWSTTTGATTADNGVTWTCIGAIGSFSGWSSPAPRKSILAGTGFMAAGNVCYADGANHAETQSAALTITTSNGTALKPLQFLSVSSAAAPPTSVSAGASISTTGASAITEGIYQYCYGFSYLAGSSSNAANLLFGGALNCIYDTCTLQLNNTSSTSTIGFNSSSGELFSVFISCSFIFGATTQTMSNVNTIEGALLKACTFAASGSIPTTLFSPTNNKARLITLQDCDLSNIVGTLIFMSSMSAGHLRLQNCKLGSGVTITSGNFLNWNEPNVSLHNCDSTNTNYRYYYANYAAVVQQETTVVRTGGATDGTTPISWNITTSANPTLISPFISEEIAIWNSSTGSPLNAVLYLTSNTSLDNSKVWIEIEYPGSASFPKGSIVNSRVSLLATATALTSDGSTWGGAISNKYSITLAFTPQMAGPVKMRIYIAAPSVTVYCDPQLEDGSSIAQSFFVPGWGYMNSVNTTSGGGAILSRVFTGR